MSQATVIRDFMVALGFQTDNAGLGKMQDAMKGVELKAKGLTAALGAMAIGAIVAVRQTASELDKLYFSSQRIGASATNINAFGNAIAQMGGSAESALGTLESISEKMRNSPGYEGVLGGLGVSTKDANGVMRDRVDVMKDLSGVLAKMPSYQANAYANALGIDQNTMLAMRDGKFVSNMEKYQKIQKELGMDDDLTKSGNEFMTEYRDLTMVTKTGFQVIVMQAGKALIPILRLLNTMIQTGIHAFSQLNPHIKEGLAVGLRFGLLAIVFGGFIKTFGMLFKFIPMLKSLIGLVKMLRLAFLASPIGIVLALASALYVLWNDYKTWKNGGKSLIDWSKWSKEIDFIVGKIKELMEWIDNLIQKVTDGIFGEGTYEGATNWIQDHVINPVKGWFGGEDQKPEEEEKAQIADVNSSELGRKSAEGIANIVKGNTETAQKQNVVANATLAATKNIIGAAKILDNGVRGVAKASRYKFSFGVDVDKYIKEASVKYGIDEKVLRGFVKMEAGWTGKMSPTGAIGTGQFIKSTWDSLANTEDGKSIGMTKIGKRFRTAQDPRYNKHINTLATGLLAKQNADVLKKYGIPITGENLYLAHNIGAETFARALSGKANAAGLKAMRQNGMKKNESPKQFVDRQRAIFMKHYNAANAENINSPSLSKEGIKNTAPPTNNPEKSQINNSNTLSKSVVIHQSLKTDVVVHGAISPEKAADAVARRQENTLAIAARNAKSQLV